MKELLFYNKTMNKILWLDDIRDPFDPVFEDKVAECTPFGEFLDEGFIWVKSFDEYIQWIKQNGLPSVICFDHDLGEDVPSGKDAANWLVEYCLDNNKKLPSFFSQSDNPAGKENILSLLNGFKDFQNSL
jgi:hypothetical protein